MAQLVWGGGGGELDSIFPYLLAVPAVISVAVCVLTFHVK